MHAVAAILCSLLLTIPAVASAGTSGKHPPPNLWDSRPLFGRDCHIKGEGMMTRLPWDLETAREIRRAGDKAAWQSMIASGRLRLLTAAELDPVHILDTESRYRAAKIRLPGVVDSVWMDVDDLIDCQKSQ